VTSETPAGRVHDGARARAQRKAQKQAARAQRPPSSAKRQQRKQNRKRRRVRRHALRRPFENALFFLLARTPLGLASRLGDVVGSLVFSLSSRARQRVLDHMTIAYGDTLSEADRHKLARRALMLAARGATSYIRLHRLGRATVLGRLEVVGVEHFDGAMEEYGSCLGVTAHYGLLELAAVYCSERHGMASVSVDTRPGTLSDRATRMRSDLGVEMIQRGDPRPIIRLLREGTPVGIVVDHDIGAVNGVFVPFFGRLAQTALGPGKLAVRLGLPLLPLFIEWTSHTTHRLTILPPLVARADLPKDLAAQDLMLRSTAIIEEWVRRRPEHWMWTHKRWATRPEDAPDTPVLEKEPPRGEQ
jgi:Kdo2-lipid IVA lauroyltransferase/acyltransferase